MLSTVLVYTKMSKTECVGSVNLVDSLDRIYDKMPKLLEQYEC